MSNYVLKVDNISKVYKLYNKPSDRLREAISITKKNYHTEFYALKNISFSLEKGESIGIIGTNGSGKSTLLKIITGVLNQTSGNAITKGRIAALLELGAGFNPEYTGLENIYLNGTLMGYSKEEMDGKLQPIINFADIGEFISQPVKSYSSGMFVRLAFATQIFSDPDILIVDEALSVGDMRFQQKCFRAMEEMMKNKTVILVTHDPAAILRFCKRAIWIEKGSLRYDGNATEALKEYQTYLLNSMEKGSQALNRLNNATIADHRLALVNIDSSVERAGTGLAEITACGLFDVCGEIVEIAEPGESYTFAMRVKFKQNIGSWIPGISIKNRLGSDIFGINSFMVNTNADVECDECEYRFIFKLPEMNAGQYTISPAIASGTYTDHVQHCWLHDAWIFRVPGRQIDIPGYIYIGNDFQFEIYH